MKYFLVLSIFIGSALLTNAQSASVGTSEKQHKTRSQGRKSAAPISGRGLYHGSKDTTPGSPMGTGGAGGEGLSGSPAGSASEEAIQAGKENANAGNQKESHGAAAAKAGKKKRMAHKNRRM